MLYVGSLADGAIWRGSARTGTGQDPRPGRRRAARAAGIHVDWRGATVGGRARRIGTIRVYNAKTGALLKEYAFPTAGFVNDLVITRTGVYATDSINQQLAGRARSGRHGKLPASERRRPPGR